MNPGLTFQRFRAVLLTLVVLSAAGCKVHPAELVGGYGGPNPQRVPIVEEVVVVRALFRGPGGGVSSMYGDRVRYIETEPHNVNRVVQIEPRELQSTVEALNLKVGDRIRISTRFVGYTDGPGSQYIPDWPYDKYFEYPIGHHFLTAVARATQ